MYEELIEQLLEDYNYDFYERIDYFGLSIEDGVIVGEKEQIKKFLMDAYDEIGYQLTKELIWEQEEVESLFEELEEDGQIKNDRISDDIPTDIDWDDPQIDDKSEEIDELLTKKQHKDLSKEELTDEYTANGFDCIEGTVTNERLFSGFILKQFLDDFDGNYENFRKALTEIFGRDITKSIMIQVYARFAPDKDAVPRDVLKEQTFFEIIYQARSTKVKPILWKRP